MTPLDTNDSLQTDAYDFELPRELIAQHPVPNRVDSRLMAVSRGPGLLVLREDQ